MAKLKGTYGIVSGIYLLLKLSGGLTDCKSTYPLLTDQYLSKQNYHMNLSPTVDQGGQRALDLQL